jgi:PadR family transcriptional regulator PadR
MFGCGGRERSIRNKHYHHLPERGWVQFLLLLLINKSPMHGYQLIDELEKRYVRHGRFKTGSVYTILNRMEKHGDLTSTIEESETGRERRVYSITDEGKDRLKRALEYMLKRKKFLDELEKYYLNYFGN